MRGLGPRAQPGSPTRTRRALRGEQVTDLCLRAGLPTGGNTRPRLRRPLRRHAHGRLVRWLLRSLRLPVGVAHQLRRNTVTVCWLHGHCIPCTQKPTAWRRHPRGSTRHSCAGPWRGRSVARTRRVEIPLLVYAWCWPCSCYNAMACIDLVLLPLLYNDARSCCCLHSAGGWRQSTHRSWPAKSAVTFFGWVFFLISLGSQHVLRAHMGHTCGEPNEIELAAAR